MTLIFHLWITFLIIISPLDIFNLSSFVCHSNFHSGDIKPLNLFLQNSPMIIGHNTDCKEAIIQSPSHNAKAVEIDLRITKDNQLVTIHDEEVDSKFCELTGKVKTFTSKQLFSEEMMCPIPNGTVILTKILDIHEAINIAYEHNLLIILELKGFEEKYASILVRKLLLIEKQKNDPNFFDKIAILGFIPSILYQVKNIEPKLSTILLVKDDLIQSGCALGYIKNSFFCHPIISRNLDSFWSWTIWNSERTRKFLGFSGIAPFYIPSKIDQIKKLQNENIFVDVWGIQKKEDIQFYLDNQITVTPGSSFGFVEE